MYKFPENLPENDNVALWQLQQFLLKECQIRFGNRDFNKVIYQPIFNGSRPIIINTPSLNGAFASLSNNAGKYWPSTLYELAHETVHLLDPVVGFTNYLEEGYAVAFSVDMAKSFTQHYQIPDDKYYLEAWGLVNQLGNNIYEVASQIRAKSSLATITPELLNELCPHLNNETIQKLCSEFNFKD